MGLETATILMIMSAASTAASVAGQKMQADAQEAANKRQYENTLRAQAENLNQTNVMQQQQMAQASEKIQESDRAALRATSTAQVSSGESGISGLSVDSLLAELAGKQGQYAQSVGTNLDNQTDALNNQRQNISIDAASQINNLKTPQMPDYIGGALKIGTSYYETKLKREQK